MAKIGFIGMGNMGYAMLKGVLNVFEPSDIIFTCPDLDKCKRISAVSYTHLTLPTKLEV